MSGVVGNPKVVVVPPQRSNIVLVVELLQDSRRPELVDLRRGFQGGPTGEQEEDHHDGSGYRKEVVGKLGEDFGDVRQSRWWVERG